jgi:hypothetical protein
LDAEHVSNVNCKANNAMTEHVATGSSLVAVAAEEARPATLQEIKIYSHSTLLYWWPAWAIGFVIAILNAGQERLLATAEGAPPSSALGLTYILVLLLLIVFTNVRLRGINSVVTLLTLAFFSVLLAVNRRRTLTPDRLGKLTPPGRRLSAVWRGAAKRSAAAESQTAEADFKSGF